MTVKGNRLGLNRGDDVLLVSMKKAQKSNRHHGLLIFSLKSLVMYVKQHRAVFISVIEHVIRLFDDGSTLFCLV
jgi:hypothetical protein